MSRRNDDPNPITIFVLGVLAVIVLGFLVVGSCWAVPQYNVYQQEKSGEAEFKKAEQNRRITVEEAQAELDASDLIRQADVIRAEGIAEANRIIGGSITDEYLRWRFIEGLHDGNSEVIYVPTEANLPILEAGRLAALSDDVIIQP